MPPHPADDRSRRARDQDPLLFRLSFSHSPIGQAFVAPDGSWLLVNGALRSLIGTTPLADTLTDVVHPGDATRVSEQLAEVAETGRAVSVDARLRDGAGTRTVRLTLTTAAGEDPDDRRIVVHVVDRTEALSAAETFRHQALHDELTGLPNRSLLTDRMLTATSRALRHGRTFAVLFCDLDHFKHVNDTLGHDVGDALLVEVAERLRMQLRGADTLARLGGDEFVIVLEDLDPAMAAEVAERVARDLLTVVSPPFTIDGNLLGITASIGITLFHAGESVKDLLRNADVAMYTAKHRGRGRAVIYDGQMRALAQHRFAMDALVRRALLTGGVVVEYQPLVALDNQRIVGAEALARIELDGRRHLPSDFIAAAEDAGTIVPLGRQVLQVALAEAAGWQSGTSVSVNVSARQLADPALPDVVIEAMAHAGMPPTRLVLEVTETTLVDNNDLAIATMRRLADLGVRIALDDFGTGWSSLAYLRRFPVSIVKIDRTFVHGATSDVSADLEVIRAVIGLSDALGIKVIAEGIETDLQAAVLTELGCAYGQGYLYGRPGPPTPLLRHGGLRLVTTTSPDTPDHQTG